PDHVSGDRRPERETHTDLLVDHADSAGQPLHNGNWNLTAGEETGLLAVVRDQRGLGEALEIAPRSERRDDGAHVVLRVEHEQVQKIAEREFALVLRVVGRRRSDALLEIRRGELLRGDAADPVLVSVGPGEE